VSRTLLNYTLGNGWPELGIPATEIRKVFARLAHQGMDFLLKSRGLHSVEMASGHLAWWFGGDLPNARLPFRWGELKGSRVLRGHASTSHRIAASFPQQTSALTPDRYADPALRVGLCMDFLFCPFTWRRRM
jgi:hypothetical protein